MGTVKNHVPHKRSHTQLPRHFTHAHSAQRSQKEKKIQRARERKKAYCCCLSQGRWQTSTSLLSKAHVVALCERQRSVERESTLHRRPKALAKPTSCGQGSSTPEEPLSLPSRCRCHHKPLPPPLKPRPRAPHLRSIVQALICLNFALNRGSK